MVIIPLYIDHGNGPIRNPTLSDTEFNTLLAETNRRNITSQLSEIDAKSARALRAIAAGTATQADTDYLASLEAEAAALRLQL